MALPAAPVETPTPPSAPVALPDEKPTKEPRARKEPKAPRAPREPKAPKAPKALKEPKAPRAPKPPKQRRVAREHAVAPRWLPGYVAAIITGALIGGLTVLLAWLTAQGCAAVRGVGTCGGYGVFALVAILGIDVIIASALLRMCRVLDPATTAMLGVGLVALLAMLFFLGDTQSSAMVYVIPILMAVTFGLAWWTTAAIAHRVDD